MFAMIFLGLGIISLPSAILGKGKERAVAFICAFVFFSAYMWEVTSVPAAHAVDVRPCVSKVEAYSVKTNYIDSRRDLENKFEVATLGFEDPFVNMIEYPRCGWDNSYTGFVWDRPNHKMYVVFVKFPHAQKNGRPV